MSGTQGWGTSSGLLLPAVRSRVAGEPPADLVAVLVEVWRPQPVVRGRLGEPDRVADRRDAVSFGANLDDGLEPHLLGEGDPVVDRVDRSAGDTRCDDPPEPLVLATRLEPF